MVRLSQMWTGVLCLLTISGLLSAGAVTVPEGFSADLLSASQRAFLVPIKITNRKFVPALVNQDSEEYKDMSKVISNLFNGIYKCDDCPTKTFYGGVAAVGFGPGSVIANAVVIFNTTSINQVVAWALFNRYAEKAAGNLQLNMAYTTKYNIMEL
ncbi:hypothetical protein INR49_014595 [Caranx melampygus]|nr:hypothetical protein INR49_014595 [Caranx melampygus]